MGERVRVRKTGTRHGRPETVADGFTVEGDEIARPAPGLPYEVRRDGTAGGDEPFATSPVRAVITGSASGSVTLLTDNSRYLIDVIGH